MENKPRLPLHRSNNVTGSLQAETLHNKFKVSITNLGRETISMDPTWKWQMTIHACNVEQEKV